MRHFTLIILLSLSLLSCSRHEQPEVVFIDDVLQSKEQLEKLAASEIFSYTKYHRPEEAPQSYRRGNDTTVIVIKTKQVETRLQRERHSLLNHFLDSVDNGANILIVVDGILFRLDEQKQLRTLPSDSLSFVDTMNFYAAQKLYGAPARPSTLIINTYSLNYFHIR